MIATPPASLRRSGVSQVALGVLVAAALVALFGGLLSPHDPNAFSGIVGMQNMPPSWAHPFGTDGLSRDVLSRVIAGARISLGVGSVAVVITVLVGTTWGALAGSSDAWLDDLLMRVVDAMLVIPRVLLLLVLASAGPMSPWKLSVALGLTAWPPMSRVVRAQVRAIRQRDWVLAARALGASRTRLLVRHILPGVMPHIAVAATLSFAAVIPLEAGLSFLGLGVRPPTASWGNIMRDGADRMLDTWWMLLFPALAIMATVAAFNAVGERWRAAVDPQQVVR
ncbi:ABC transporter permease [bacterium]|jgi:peptide/nickel transport system permease protein|nr:ABC transporter permease [bacterium]